MPRTPKQTDKTMPVPAVTESNTPTPEFIEEKKPAPPVGLVENQVQFGNTVIEIKPTKLKYQRDRTAAFYRLLQKAPVVELLALEDGILDPERSSDKMLFDWLIAVTDDPKLVVENYDDIDSETIDRMLKIFCRLNHIKDEDAKKQQAQVTTA